MEQTVEKWLFDRLDRVIEIDKLKDSSLLINIISHVICRYRIIKETELKFLVQCDNLSMKFNYLKHLLRKIDVEIPIDLEEGIMCNNLTQMKILLFEIYFKLSNKDSQLFEMESELVYKTDMRTDIKNINKRLLMASGDGCSILNAIREHERDLHKSEKIEKRRKKMIHLLRLEQEVNAAKIRILAAKQMTREQRLLKIAELNIDKAPCDCPDKSAIVPVTSRTRINRDMIKFEIKNNEMVKSYAYQQLKELEEAAKEMDAAEPNLEAAYKYIEEIKEKIMEAAKKLQEDLIKAAQNKLLLTTKEGQPSVKDSKSKKKPPPSAKEKKKKKEKNPTKNLPPVVEPPKEIPQADIKNTKKAGKQPMSLRDKEELKSLELKKKQEEKFLMEQKRLFKLHRKLYRKTLCQKILEDKVTYDSVINGCLDIASHKMVYEKKYRMPLPDDIFIEWKQLVVYGIKIKDVPFDLPTDFCDCDKTYNEIKTMVRTNELASQRELRDYLHLQNNWKSSNSEPELTTISHVVLSLLDKKYPKVPKEIKITRDLKCKTVFHFDVEFRNEFINSLQALIEIHKIVIITMKDVIDFCIQFYITERINKLEDDLYEFDDEYNIKTQVPLSTKSSKAKSSKEKRAAQPVPTGNIEVDTQTPICIPDYYQFSPCGAIGKKARVYLAENQPIDTQMSLNMLMEFINNKPDIEGFVLLDFPREESDIVEFEKMCTSMTPDIYNIGKPHNPRKSKLLPTIEDDEQFVSYLTNFIKLEKNTDNDYSALIAEENPIDNFYKEQGIFSLVKYNQLTLELTKYIARLIIGDFTMPRKTSDVLFGVTITEEVVKLDDETIINVFIQRKKEVTSKGKGKAGKKPIVVEVIIPDTEIGVQTSDVDIYRCCQECESANRIREKWYENVSEVEIIPYVTAKHVDKNALDKMIDFWQKLEVTYLFNIKTVMQERLHFLDQLHLFHNYVRKMTKEFLERPTFNKNFVNNLRDSYYLLENKLKENLIKDDLHCIVVEIHSNLHQLCDVRYRESLELRENLMKHNFFSSLLTTLTNTTLHAFCFELNRGLKTLCLLQTYYYCIMKRTTKYKMTEVVHPKFLSPPMFNDEIPIYLQDKPPMPEIPYREMPCDCFLEESKYNYEAKFGDEYLQKFTKLKIEDIKALQDLANCIQEKIKEIESPSMFVEYLRSQLDCSFKMLDITKIKLENKILSETIKYVSNDPRLPDLSDILIYEHDPLVKVTLKLVQEEALAAYNEECERVKVRLTNLCDKTINEINEFIERQRNIYEVFRENINDRMEHEKLCCDYLVQICHQAIESTGFEKRRKWLDDNRFIIQTGVIIFPDYPTPEFYCENICPSNFMLNVNQLMKFVNEMSKIAPKGYCSFDTLAYYLKDIAGCGQLDKNERVPETWNNLNQSDIEILLRKLYSCIPVLDWRDFVINNLDIRLPTINEILEMRNEFKSYALQKSLEVISRKNYNKCHLWYESDIENKKITFDDPLKWKYFWLRNLLFKLYQSTPTSLCYSDLLLGLCKDENPRVGFIKALSLCKGKLFNDSKELEQQYLALLTMKRDRHDLLRQEICEKIVHEMIDQVVQQCDGIEIRDATSSDIRYVEEKLRKLEEGETNNGSEAEISVISTPAKSLVLEQKEVINEEVVAESSFISVISRESSFYEYQKLESTPFTDREFWIEPNIVILLLEKSFPWYRIEFDKDETMKQRIYNIFQSIINDRIVLNEPNPEVDDKQMCIVLVHKLLDRYFIREWIEKGLKFKKLCPGLIVLDILQKEHEIHFFK